MSSIRAFPKPTSIERAANLASVDHDPGMQDWPIEVSDGTRLEEFVALLLAHADDWELTYWFVDLVLESARARADHAAWSDRLAAILVTSWSKSKAWQVRERIEYWACLDQPLEDAFEVAPAARSALERIAVSCAAWNEAFSETECSNASERALNAVFRDRAPAWERAGIFAVDVVSLPLEGGERARWLISIDLARGGVVRRTLRVELWEDGAIAVGDDLTGQGSPLMNEARSFRGDEVTNLAHRAADWIEGELAA